MRRRIALALPLALAACVGGKHHPVSIAPTDRETRQCLADLRDKGVRFSRIPDRVFDGGCSQIGTVNLLDYGVPTRGLGAVRCAVAGRFVDWVRDAVQPAAEAWLGARVARIESFGTYACRPVNGQAGRKLSEHGFANALDVAAFVLADGRRVSVKDGWSGADAGARDFLRAVHKAACRRFGVVLGPEADAFHRDHFHLDMASGRYCR